MIQNVDHPPNLLPSRWPHSSSSTARRKGKSVDKRWGVLGLAYASVSLKQQSGLGLGMVFLSGQIPSDLRGWVPDIVLIESQRRRRIAKLAMLKAKHREAGSVDKGEENSSRRCGYVLQAVSPIRRPSP